MGKGRNAQKMPACSYGVACTRRDCVYTHPPRPVKNKAPVAVPKTGKPCLAHLAGLCTFGSLCHNNHPSDDECARLRAEYALRPCHFGVGCRSVGCLYAHPVDTTAAQQEETDYANHGDYNAVDSSSSSAAEAAAAAGAAAVPLTFTERLELFFSSLSAKALSSLPSSSPSAEAAEVAEEGKEKAVVEAKLAAQLVKIPTMLARYEGREEDLFSALSAKHGEDVPGPQRPDESEIASATSLLSAVSLHDGVSVAYNNNSNTATASLPLPTPLSSSSSSSSSSPPAAPRPPPAPLPPDAVPQVWRKANKPSSSSNSSSSSSSSSGGWKSSAAAAPAFVPSSSNGSASTSSSYSMGVDTTHAAGDAGPDSRTAALARVSFVPIPQHLWTIDVARDPAAFTQADPMARFEAVNGSIGASATGLSRQKSRRLGVLDLHFQSTRTFGPVLDALLWPEVEAVWAEHERSGGRPSAARDGSNTHGKGGSRQGGTTTTAAKPAVWVVTGTGHHTGQSHVKAGSLYTAVGSYLLEGGYDFARGRDNSGYSGAFAVYG